MSLNYIFEQYISIKTIDGHHKFSYETNYDDMWTVLSGPIQKSGQK